MQELIKHPLSSLLVSLVLSHLLSLVILIAIFLILGLLLLQRYTLFLIIITFYKKIRQQEPEALAV
jgi:hypothetical protein